MRTGSPPIDQLADRFRRFPQAAGRAPLYARLAMDIANDVEVLRLLAVTSDEQAIPVLLFAAVHDLLLSDPTEPLARHYRNLTDRIAAPPATADPWPLFRDFALSHADAIRDLVGTRHTQTNETGRCALFLPPLSVLALEVGGLALVDIGASAGLNLLIGHYAYRYRPGGEVGPASTVVIECETRGAVDVPRTMPMIDAAIGLDAMPIDVHDDAGVRWLEACVWPDQIDRFDRLVAAIEIARHHGVDVRRGDAVDDLAATVRAAAATGGHPVVTNSWVLNYLTPERRMAYVAELDRLGTTADLSWVLAESPSHTVGLPIPTTDPPEEPTVVSLVRWRDGIRSVQRLARCHPHGYWMDADGAVTG